MPGPYIIRSSMVRLQLKFRSIPEKAYKKSDKMKFIFGLLATLAVVGPLYAYQLPATGSGALAHELQKIMDLVPFEKVLEITKTYAAQDKQFQAVIGVLKTSPHLRHLVKYTESSAVFQNQLKTVENLGFDMRSIVNYYNERIGLAPLTPLAASDLAISGGILGYLKDVADVVPIDKIEKLIDSELKTSKVLQEFVSSVTLKENVDFYWSIYQNPHYLQLKEQITQQGVSGLLFQNNFPLLAFAATVV